MERAYKSFREMIHEISGDYYGPLEMQGVVAQIVEMINNEGTRINIPGGNPRGWTVNQLNTFTNRLREFNADVADTPGGPATPPQRKDHHQGHHRKLEVDLVSHQKPRNKRG